MTIRKQTPWEIQKSVVFALFTRELSSRFGTFKLGYFWAILDPVFGIAALCLIRMAMGNGPIEGVAYPLFFASGMLIYRVFGGLGQSSLGQIESNLTLLNYQRIKPLDPILSRSIMEILLSCLSIFVVLGGFAYFGFTFKIGSILNFVEVYFLLACFSLGFGLVVATCSPFFQDLKKIIPVILLPMFFLSGVFFSLNSMPEAVIPFLIWNPVLHAIELGREAVFETYISLYGDRGYLYLSALVSLTIGLSLFRRFQAIMVTSGTIKLT